jgi:hypothetical protein
VKATPPTSGFYVSLKREGAPLTEVAINSLTPRTCPHCHSPLTEIDYYGDRLVDCIEYNRWGWPGDASTLPMQLLEDDLEAIRTSRRR